MMRAETYWYDVMRRRTDIPVPEVYFRIFRTSFCLPIGS